MKFSHKIFLMPLLAGIAFLIVFGITRRGEKNNERLLEQIETQFFQALELSHKLEKLAVQTRHMLQDAITVEDEDMIIEADGLRDEFLKAIEKGKSIKSIRGEDVQNLSECFTDYYEIARRVTQRMIYSELTEELFADVAMMNEKRGILQQKLDESTRAQEFAMVEAFASARASYNVNHTVVALSFMISLGLILTISFIVIISVIRPLTKITVAAEAIAEGSLDEKIDYHSKDEMGRLVDTFRSMQSSLISDIARRETVEEALRSSEVRFRSLVENVNDVIYSTDLEGRFTYLSPKFEDYTGYKCEEFLGRRLSDLMHEEDIKKYQDFLLTSGSNTGKSQDIQYRVIGKDGRLGWFITNASEITDDSGKPVEIIGATHDITELKNALDNLEEAIRELRRTQAQLVQSEKMASLGKLVAGVAHEFNNPIGAVLSTNDNLKRGIEKLTKIIEESIDISNEVKDNFMRVINGIKNSHYIINEGAGRVSKIVQRMKAFSHLDEAEIQLIDIHRCIEDGIEAVPNSLLSDIAIERQFGEIPKVMCYPAKINQAILSIVLNAAEAVQSEGTIKIETSHSEDIVAIIISDDGTGIPSDIRERIFDPGFTTKSRGVGTGLGLAISYQVMKEHNGSIEISSEIGIGTEVKLTLPVNIK